MFTQKTVVGVVVACALVVSASAVSIGLSGTKNLAAITAPINQYLNRTNLNRTTQNSGMTNITQQLTTSVSCPECDVFTKYLDALAEYRKAQVQQYNLEKNYVNIIKDSANLKGSKEEVARLIAEDARKSADEKKAKCHEWYRELSRSWGKAKTEKAVIIERWAINYPTCQG